MPLPRPTARELAAARTRTVPDVIAPDLKVLFCGINPSLYSAATGHHFARPGNRFWPALHQGGFTPRQLSPDEERELLQWGWGITNLVDRATAAADELTRDELAAGALKLTRKIEQFHPRCLAILGITAYRCASGRVTAHLGLQDEPLGKTRIWILPNPSGLNAHYQLKDLARMFQQLRRTVEAWR